MAHPFAKHSQNAVGHRRARLLTTGREYARGGHTDEAEDKKLMRKMMKEHDKEEGEGKASGGAVAAGRLDKRARGGAIKLQTGGGAFHKLTPSKHKPHMAVNITNISRGGGGGGGAGRPGIGPLGAPPIGARIARPIAPPIGGAPVGPPPIRPPGMKTGGRAKYAAGGRMRTGKKFGEGSGEGRLEEFKHMRGK